jgi:hypothetical protein
MTYTRTLRTAFAALALVAIPAQAQQDTTVRIDTRWRAFLGCWNTVSAQGVGPRACFVPTSSANTVELVTVAGDSVLTSTSIVTSGDRVRVRRDGCTGWESARWSADERRLYTTAELTCDGGATQQLQSLYSINHNDQLTRIDGLKTQTGNTAVRLLTFYLSGSDSTSIPAPLASRLPPATAMASYAARVDASELLSVADIADAAQALDATVVEAWLVDRGEALTLSARDLRAMRDAKVPPSVIDMVIAVSNPQIFRVAQNRSPEAIQNSVGSAGSDICRTNPELCGVGRGTSGFGNLFDPIYGWGNGWNNGYGAWSPFYGSRFYNPYWANCNFGLGCNGFGWQNNGWQTGGTFVIVPQQPSGPERIPGRAVNGSGYSQGGSSDGGRVASPSPSVSNGGGYSQGGGSSAGSGGYSGGGSSSGGSSSSGSSSSGGEQRTAKPRP